MGSLSTYSSWIKADPSRARQIEDGLRLLSYVPIASPAAGELIGELLYAASNLLGLIHDSCINGSVTSAAPSPFTAAARWSLSILASIDVLIEVAAVRSRKASSGGRAKSDSQRHRVVVLVEAARALLKLFVLSQSIGDTRMQRDGGQITSNVGSGNDAAGGGVSKGVRYWRGGLTGLAVPLPPDYHSQRDQPGNSAASSNVGGTSQSDGTPSAGIATLVSLLRQSWSAITTTPPSPARVVAEHVCRHGAGGDGTASTTAVYPAASAGSSSTGGTSCDAEAAPLFALAEVLFILRPLFTTLFESTGDGTRRIVVGGWVPMAVSLLMDVASHRLTHVAAGRAAGRSQPVLPAMLTSIADKIRGNGTHQASNDTLLSALASSPTMAPLLAGIATPPSADDGDASTVTAALATSGTQLGVAGRMLRLVLNFLSSPPGLSPVEAAEVHRRKLLLLLYLMRKPVYSSLTSPVADRVTSSLAWLPLIGPALAYGRDVMAYTARHHFYTSGSQ